MVDISIPALITPNSTRTLSASLLQDPYRRFSFSPGMRSLWGYTVAPTSIFPLWVPRRAMLRIERRKSEEQIIYIHINSNIKIDFMLSSTSMASSAISLFIYLTLEHILHSLSYPVAYHTV